MGQRKHTCVQSHPISVLIRVTARPYTGMNNDKRTPGTIHFTHHRAMARASSKADGTSNICRDRTLQQPWICSYGTPRIVSRQNFSCLSPMRRYRGPPTTVQEAGEQLPECSHPQLQPIHPRSPGSATARNSTVSQRPLTSLMPR